jgi:F-type H+-transporting ATPase subunit delta
MDHSKIAVRYAKALFDLALEHNAIDPVYDDMKTVDRLCAMDEVKEIIDNPVIPKKKRTEIILALAGDNINGLTVKFIELVFSNDRGDHLAGAARNYINLTRRHKGIRQVSITTAVPVQGKTKEELAAVVAGEKKGKIEYLEHIDRSIIGGFIVRVDDIYIDASVRTRLNRFRKEFSLAGNDEKVYKS